MFKDKSIRFKLIAEMIISILVLPYFFLTMITPFHILDFIGAFIIVVALVHNIFISLQAIRALRKLNSKPKEQSNKKFLTWYLLPTYIGLTCINISDFITDEKYTNSNLTNDFLILNIITIILISFYYITSRNKKSH